MAYSADEQAALNAKQALLKAEADLAALKDSGDENALRAAKDALRLQRELFRLEHRATYMSLEAAGVVVTPDSITTKGTS